MQWSWDELKKIGYGFKSGQTNQKYKTVLNELNVIETEKRELPETIIKSFKNEEYKSYITIDDIILYSVLFAILELLTNVRFCICIRLGQEHF